ncbi:ribonuclease E [Drepanopeziza brunnea f. sp. 'multigermtubi' MB_m1]|uniref:Ribonuclease E n=1 Tax=Marssonina brunnea f. sp. multigermtubi (strain MB_m1) TaxID=1072389 RepID=K1WC94_MARBU|nr:ribonuclease E [Drepanopeziza brunnea f. sp. 'multigermtubi' MB_m1]EKD14995.1 ribonuclease E [Drepanopeziza brunnea f. sp. 'multigermtubi' MB_m1]
MVSLRSGSTYDASQKPRLITPPEAEPVQAEPETEPEAEPEAEPETEPETELETEPEAEPETEPEAEPEAKLEGEPKAKVQDGLFFRKIPPELRLIIWHLLKPPQGQVKLEPVKIAKLTRKIYRTMPHVPPPSWNLLLQICRESRFEALKLFSLCLGEHARVLTSSAIDTVPITSWDLDESRFMPFTVPMDVRHLAIHSYDFDRVWKVAHQRLDLETLTIIDHVFGCKGHCLQSGGYAGGSLLPPYSGLEERTFLGVLHHLLRTISRGSLKHPNWKNLKFRILVTGATRVYPDDPSGPLRQSFLPPAHSFYTF